VEILNDNQPTVLHSVDAMAVVDLVIACDGGVAVWLCECHGHDNVCCGRWMNVVNLVIGTSVAMLQCCVASALLCLLWFPVGWSVVSGSVLCAIQNDHTNSTNGYYLNSEKSLAPLPR
jgi:hypothetical protein